MLYLIIDLVFSVILNQIRVLRLVTQTKAIFTVDFLHKWPNMSGNAYLANILEF